MTEQVSSAPGSETPTPLYKDTRRLCVGDAIVFASIEHRISRIEPYNGALADLGAFAIAHSSDGWLMTLFRGQAVEVAP